MTDENKYNSGLIDALAAQVAEYESDTFSAIGSNLSVIEAREVVETLIKTFFEDHVDGIVISQALDVVREENAQADAARQAEGEASEVTDAIEQGNDHGDNNASET